MIPLFDCWKQLNSDFNKYFNEFDIFIKSQSGSFSASNFRLKEECYLEGMLSRVWQSWCIFCRSCLIESCLGTVSTSGVSISRLPFAHSESHVSGAAIRAKDNRAKSPYWGNTNSVLRLEPTWGNVDLLVDIINRLSPNNSAQLIAAFSSGSINAKTLQVIRNATAHNNRETDLEVQNLRSRYKTFPITHPIQAIFWEQRHTMDFLVIDAMKNLLSISDAAIY